MEADLKALVEKIASLNLGANDPLQAGVLESTDWSFTPGIVSGTGELSSAANTGGTAWIADPVLTGALMRTFTTPFKLGGLKPPSLPASGKFMSVGFNLTPGKWGGAATVSLSSGAEQTTSALAEANPSALVAGKVRIRDVVINNTAGSYSIFVNRERRPWARGVKATINRTGGTSTLSGTGKAIDAANLALRVECSGAAIRLELRGTMTWSGGTIELGFGFNSDGVAAAGTGSVGTLSLVKSSVTEGRMLLNFVWEITPAAGSHLFQPTNFGGGGGTVQLLGTAEQPAQFSVFEDVRPSANNGTS